VRCRFLLILLLAMLSTALAADDSGARREDQLKAAYLFNFAKFVEWPANNGNQPLTVCFVGGVGVHDALASGIGNKRVGARPLAVRLLLDAGTLSGCNVLYVDSAVAANSAPASGLAVLTISDAKAFARNGGMIELFAEDNRLRFKVNVENAERAGLRISSNLLQLAASVEKGGTK